MKIYNIINIPKGLSQEIECDCREEYNSGYTEGLEEGFDKGYDSGYTDGAESVDCEDFYNSGYTDGYESGYTSGYTDGQESVDCTDFYNSGVTDGYASGYTSGRTDGYDDGWQPGYDSGRTDGEKAGYDTGYEEGKEYQKAQLVSTAITTNGTYEREDGFNQVVVNVPSMSGAGYDSGYTDGYESGYTDGSEDGFDSGYTSGATDQKNKMEALQITENDVVLRDGGVLDGFFQREDGWNDVSAVIYISPYIQEYGYKPGYASGYTSGVTDGYASGYTSGKTDGYGSGVTAGEEAQKAKMTHLDISENDLTNYQNHLDGNFTREDGWNDIFVSIDINPDINSAWTRGYEAGYPSGVTDGYASGYTSGRTDGYQDGWTPGYNSGYTDGVNTCGGDYASGYTDGFEHGYDSGHTDGYNEGYQSGNTDGFDTGYDSGYTDGQASVNCQDFYDSGYTSGHTDGIREQKSKLVADVFNANGAYSREDGWNNVIINVPQTGHTDQEMQDSWNSGYTSGRTDGEAAGWETGYNQGYNSGRADGEEAQKAKLTFTAFTANGTYTRPDGWSAVTVNVPQTGYTQQDLDNAFNSGWTGGYSSGYTDGLNDCTGSTAATSLSFNVPSYVTDGAETSVSVSPSSADVDIVYESDNESAATIDSAGTITVLEDGAEVTFCATDLNSGLQDCQTRLVYTGRASADVTCYYYKESTDGTSTKKLSSEEFLVTLEKMYIDGVEVTPVSSYTFTNGPHVVEYYISSNYQKIIGASFSRCEMKKVIVSPRMDVHPNGLEIEYNAFSSCREMSALTLAEGVNKIGNDAFVVCSSIADVAIPDSCTYIGEDCFSGASSMRTLHLGTGLTSIYGSAFKGCSSLTSLVIPDNVIRLGNGVFANCYGLTNVVLGSGLTYVTGYTFQNCSGLTSVTFRNSLSGTIPYGMFKSCTNLVDCTVPSGITEIKDEAFYDTKLSAVTLPEGITTIARWAYFGCGFVTAVTLPSTITSIGDGAFYGTVTNTSITIKATTPPVLETPSGSYASLGQVGIPIYVPAGSVEAYKANSNYVVYKDYIQAIQ